MRRCLKANTPTPAGKAQPGPTDTPESLLCVQKSQGCVDFWGEAEEVFPLCRRGSPLLGSPAAPLGVWRALAMVLKHRPPGCPGLCGARGMPCPAAELCLLTNKNENIFPCVFRFFSLSSFILMLSIFLFFSIFQ